jgi:hypothetical protein
MFVDTRMNTTEIHTPANMPVDVGISGPRVDDAGPQSSDPDIDNPGAGGGD